MKVTKSEQGTQPRKTLSTTQGLSGTERKGLSTQDNTYVTYL